MRDVASAIVWTLVIVVALAVMFMGSFFSLRYWKWRQSRWRDDWRWHL